MKYLWSYSIPLIGIVGIYFGGIFSYAALLYAFILIPILELVLPVDNRNYNDVTILHRANNVFYDLILYINIPIVFGILVFTLYRFSYDTLSVFERIGMILSLGIILGANGINVAHELGHRATFFEKILAKLLLIPSHYTHFYIEHNHGHHLHVSTPEDPSTAQYNQTVYAFWMQTVFGTYTKAWKIQRQLNTIEGRNFFSLKNDMFWFTIIQCMYLIGIYFYFNSNGFVIAFFSGIVGFLLLETINYIEHYGLRRLPTSSGRYERVSEKHSWNSNHLLGRVILYELTRHSDHHYKSQKKYQVLACHDKSPQMPYGYPTSMVLSFFPPLWFKVMNKRIPLEMKP